MTAIQSLRNLIYFSYLRSSKEASEEGGLYIHRGTEIVCEIAEQITLRNVKLRWNEMKADILIICIYKVGWQG